MIYRRKTYKVLPEHVAPFTAFFEEYLLPNQRKHGAVLVGRFVTEAQDEIVAIWAYPSFEEYQRIEAAVRRDAMHQVAQARRQALSPLFLESREDFLQPTGDYQVPKHIVSASGYITRQDGAVLLVKTFWREDTWEMPGGQVEEGEAPHLALEREVREETGLEICVTGLTGVYYNSSRSIVNITFRGEVVGGELRTSPETKAVDFFHLTPDAAGQLITREHFLSRTLDAMQASGTSTYEAYLVNPHRLVSRLG